MDRIDLDRLGRFVGNQPDHPPSIPGIRRDSMTIFEFGDLETSFSIRRHDDGFALMRTDRGVDWTLVEFTHLDDAARYFVVREGRSRNPARWFAAGAAAPEGVEVVSGGTELHWRNGNERHELRALSDQEGSVVLRFAWVRSLPLADVIDVVLSASPIEHLRSR